MSAADTTQQDAGAADAQPAVRSGVRLEMNAKGFAQVKTSVYVGDTAEDLQLVKDIAIDTYTATIRELQARGVAVAA